MTDASSIQIPRARYGLAMLAATLVALALGWIVATRLGADGGTQRILLLAFAFGAFATAVPACFPISREYWGLAVVVSGVGRAMLMLGVCFVTREVNPEMVARPLFLGVASGAMLLLFTEVVLAVRNLSDIERRRTLGAAPSDPATRKPA